MNFQPIYIVNENPILIQTLCKLHRKDTFRKFVIGCILFYVMTNWIPNLLSLYFPTTINSIFAANLGEQAEMLPQYPVVFLFYAFAFQGVFQLGQALYALTYMRNRSTEYSALFEGFGLYFKALMISVMQSLIITLWSMLFIIPGVIAMYGFRQSYYILADNPEKGVMRCMAESKFRMTGNKMNLFRLDVSYIPYLLLGYLPQVILAYIPGINLDSLPGVLLYFAADIPMIWAMAAYGKNCLL